jgi:thiamine-monophosphate kinase
VLTPPKGELCVTTDQVVEGVHFVRPGFTWEEIGHKALAVNLSDLAAMGANPLWFVCAIAGPRGLTLKKVRALGRGMASLARRHGIALVGGNFSSSPVLTLTLTVMGKVPRGRALLRSGGRAGDLLYVSGTLGGARAALSGRRHQAHWRTRQNTPEPRLALGLLARSFARAAVDVSDGLANDLGHLCEASRVGAELVLSSLPIERGATLEEALSGGEDYELILAVPPVKAPAFEAACRRAGEAIARIGRLVTGRGVVGVGERGPRRLEGGFDHFRVER